MPDEKEILSEVEKTLEGHGFNSYDELRSAVESKRLLREILGMKRARRLTAIATLTAFLSAGAAVGGFLALIWQSESNQIFNLRDTLQMRIANLNDDIEDLQADKKSLTTENNSLVTRISASQAQATDLENVIATLNVELSALRANLARLQASQVKVEREISGLGIRPGQTGSDLPSRLKSALSQKAILDDRIQTSETRIANLNRQLADTRQSRELATTRNTDLEQRVARLQLTADVVGFGGMIESGLVRRGNQQQLSSNGDTPDSYQIKLTNVGNIDHNIDLEIVSQGTGATTNLVNLNMGQRYAAAFDGRLFLIHVINAVKNNRKKDEQGEYSVILLRNEHKLVY